MTIKVLNNWKFKRHFSHGFWYRHGFMFPWTTREYLQIGIFGLIVLIQWGSYESRPEYKYNYYSTRGATFTDP